MNREIKFRRWDGYEFRYGIDFIEMEEAKIYSFEDILKSEIILQQFTGFKDINGLDIYEGDILKFGKLNYEVKWSNNGWTAVCPYYVKYHWPTFEYFSREARISNVVGNIFQNPELLEKK